MDGKAFGRWEEGRTRPTFYAPLLCELYGKTAEELDLVEAAGTMKALKRPEFLDQARLRAVDSAADQLDMARIAEVLHHSLAVDRRVLEDLVTMTQTYGRQVHTFTPAGLLPFVRFHFADLMTLLTRSQPGSVQRQLELLAGETAVIAGYLSYRLHNYGDAETYFGSTDLLAREAGDEPLRALGLIARSALYSPVPHGGVGGDPRTALALLDAAESAAGCEAPPLHLTWLHARRVEDYASCDQGDASDRSLEQAERTFSRVPARDQGFFHNWTPGRLIGYRGSAAVMLKRSSEAVAIVDTPLKQAPSVMASERSFLLIIQAAGYADQEQVERSCALLSEAFVLARDAGLVERIRRIKGTRRNHLDHWSLTASVRQLDEQLLSV
ncbi:MAG: hypothetical protein DLM67_04870 [Candidatus Nephthysia bennettiae]|nr:hypothetical protein [Candidatus Dormibacteraeota bacterium]PZR98918.1 MAG: hypothetical protein DLM67_04870 [Candidatus Dormibacteraeota bacterium]